VTGPAIGLRFAAGQSFAPDAGGQLSLTTEPTGAAAVCRRCGQPVSEVLTLTSRVWTHLDGDWRCPAGGLAEPRGWSA
jgi:hypothetical protein